MKPEETNQVASLHTAGSASGALALAAAALLVSCAAAPEARRQEALVCPQCRMIEVRTASIQPGGRYPGFPQRRWGGGITYPGTIYEHRCEGCQGVLMTFLREGKFQHKCSICSETPFTCPVIHPS